MLNPSTLKSPTVTLWVAVFGHISSSCIIKDKSNWGFMGCPVWIYGELKHYTESKWTSGVCTFSLTRLCLEGFLFNYFNAAVTSCARAGSPSPSSWFPHPQFWGSPQPKFWNEQIWNKILKGQLLKRTLWNDSSQTKVLKHKFRNERSETTALKLKFRNKSSETQVLKPKRWNKSSETRVLNREVWNESFEAPARKKNIWNGSPRTEVMK